jgi:SAM-dependent methyltransferase
MDASDRHLDLGCGKFPRNPYGRSELCGVDLRPAPAGVAFEHRVANLVLEPIPYPDSSFASVSAYDFIEHVPRLLPTADGGGTVFPFIRLMNEVWRVLAPGGRFYALTPAFPNPEAFTDPTHVNIITHKTHEYFSGEQPMGRMYGFSGQFKALRVEWVHVPDVYSPIAGSPDNRKPPTATKRLARAVRGFFRRLRGKPAERKAHLLWEFEAIKPD